MKIVLDVKNSSKVLNPGGGDVLLYDGTKWYVTTKDELLKESKAALDKSEDTYKKLKKEMADFRKKVSEDMVKMSNEIIKLLNNEEKKL